MFQKLPDPDFISIELELPGFDFRDIQQAVDQAGQVLGITPDDPNRIQSPDRNGGVAFQNLRIADHGIERRAQLVAEPDDVSALRLAGGLGLFLGFLQLGVGFLVRLDFLKQQFGLPPGFLFGNPAAFVNQDKNPRRDTRDDA